MDGEGGGMKDEKKSKIESEAEKKKKGDSRTRGSSTRLCNKSNFKQDWKFFFPCLNRWVRCKGKLTTSRGERDRERERAEECPG